MKARTMCIFIAILVGIDQLIKVIINKFYLNTEFEIIPSILDFKPTFNHKYFYINSLFNLGDGYWMHIILIIIGLFAVLGANFYLKRKKQDSIISSIGFTFLLAGLISALICTVFWNGTLDYLYFKPYFVFDLKDVYLNSFLPCGIILCIIQYRNQERSSN